MNKEYEVYREYFDIKIIKKPVHKTRNTKHKTQKPHMI